MEVEFLEKYKKSIISNIVKTLIKETWIYKDEDQEELVTEKELKDLLLKPKEFKRCNGILKNSTQCPNSSFDKFNYCKKHCVLNTYAHKITKAEPIETIEIIPIEITKKKITTKLKKKFIDDSFYNIDEYYIYDTETLEKVGYLTESNEYIFTTDPFLLND